MGQIDLAEGDKHDFFSIHAGGLEHTRIDSKLFGQKPPPRHGLCSISFPYDAFPVPPQGGFRGEEWETQLILPAHTDPIHFTVDPGSDTIARG